ncbi:MAG: hypothetical protein M9894_09730 [Planctomycetes bacterium]|nr:hypothetical protein [Planctomycetota bacterium]
MKTTLTAEAELFEVQAFAELAVWEARPDLQRLCSAAAKAGLGDAEIDGVLPGLSPTARKNFVRSLVEMRLLNERRQLTPLGLRCASTGQAPAWEMGVYRLLVAFHRVTGSCVLACRPAEGDARDRDFDSLEDHPPWLIIDPDEVWASALGESMRFSVRFVPIRNAKPRCRVFELPACKLLWDVDPELGRNSWRLEGSVDDPPKTFRSEPRSVDEKKLAGAIARWDKRWNRTRRRVEMAYDGARPNGNDDFRRAFNYPEVHVADYGAFRDVVVEGIPVGPATEAEAREWALALATARVAAADQYVTGPKWGAEWERCVKGTPLEQAAAAPPLPTAVRSAGRVAVAARTRWLLSAATDLGVE